MTDSNSTRVSARIRQAERHLSRADPVLARLIRAHGPCTLGRRPADPFHTLATSIISQQLSTRAASTIQERVAARVGAHPRLAPAHFLGVSHETLRACGLSNAKARWLRDIAGRVHRGEFSFGALITLDDAAALETLDALPGVGRWTAEMFLIFALGRPDLFAMDDIGLRRSVNTLYGRGRRLSDRRTLDIAQRWAPYRSVASWYLWRFVEGENPAW
ncbi:MAG: DNA-3-methyladenine glycosylase 2 family protein [Nevskiales bacterium]|nr:DNA-3-methyladenine glycosylase 2 family protein [Nevskiales bacterium]